jgi:hypothetical protein
MGGVERSRCRLRARAADRRAVRNRRRARQGHECNFNLHIIGAPPRIATHRGRRVLAQRLRGPVADPCPRPIRQRPPRCPARDAPSGERRQPDIRCRLPSTKNRTESSGEQIRIKARTTFAPPPLRRNGARHHVELPDAQLSACFLVINTVYCEAWLLIAKFEKRHYRASNKQKTNDARGTLLIARNLGVRGTEHHLDESQAASRSR